MGTKLNAQTDTESEYVYSVKQMCRMAHERSINLFKSIDILFNLSKDSKIQEKAVNVLHNYTDEVIRRRKNLKLQEAQSCSQSEHDENGKRKLALLDLLLEYNMRDEPLLDETQIREEVDTFMFGVIDANYFLP